MHLAASGAVARMAVGADGMSGAAAGMAAGFAGCSGRTAAGMLWQG